VRVLITGGAGFVGSSLAKSFRASGHDVCAFDNLKRRGSELNLPDFKRRGIQFVYGDVRSRGDLDDLNGTFDLFVEASAEPSVLAGLDGSPDYLLHTNLLGNYHCLEFARRRAPHLIFLSTSRVYSIAPLRELPLKEASTRLELDESRVFPKGLTHQGITEEFEVMRARSLYGATKLSSELLLQEYAETYRLQMVIDRCGVIAGPGQWGKVDQGVFTLWVVNHFFGKPLRYTGFGGNGKQVRDLLHPADLFRAIETQYRNLKRLSGETFNLGGGLGVSTSLLELTQLCQTATGRSIEIGRWPETNPADIPWYVTDSRKAQRTFGFRVERTIQDILEDIHFWLKENSSQIKEIFT